MGALAPKYRVYRIESNPINEFHTQVILGTPGGLILVDEHMPSVIATLRSNDFTTLNSCQGGPDRNEKSGYVQFAPYKLDFKEALEVLGWTGQDILYEPNGFRDTWCIQFDDVTTLPHGKLLNLTNHGEKQLI